MKVVCFSALLLIFFNLSAAAIKGSAADSVEKAEEEDCECRKKHEKPMDCAEVLENGNTESGVYTIWPRSRLADGASIEVYCDMVTDGGGWIVIQRRCHYGNGEDYFVKNWNEYKKGFGEIKKELWLGNDNIHYLTNQGQYSVRFDMKSENRTYAFAVYENFWIGNEESKYRIHLSEYSGTAGDSLSTHSGGLFYTADQPNLPSGRDGKTMRSGGWWFNIMPSSSLNGLNLLGTDRVGSRDGISWKTFGGYDNSLTGTDIKIRPKRFH